ncbi:uncharacterized protein LOC123409119 [Hordeum vulgare subsp. vulgare]|uniref:uncharacterized protein LOC123409119 n=1 Tax=Hordeum vulgare subsp. vulgare TaxID=112509 RepID=UPI001D1A427E|nr:uncharacterized protein LOC123409119 [Hordeum vulgare subsp. vulgare]
MRLGLGTFDNPEDGARAYDPIAWRLRRPRREMNFLEVMTREWTQRLTPPLWLVTEEDHRQNRRRERRLGIAEMDEHAMTAWRQQFPQDVLDERAFFTQKRAERALYREDMRMRKQATFFNIELKEASTWDLDDERLAHASIATEEWDTNESEEDDEE